MDLFKDTIASLSVNKNHLLDDNDENQIEYVKQVYMVNDAFSRYADTIFFANEMNCNKTVTAKMNYDFYFYGLEASKRFTKWAKEAKDDMIDDIMNYFSCSKRHAKQYDKILTEEQKNLIKNKLHKNKITK